MKVKELREKLKGRADDDEIELSFYLRSSTQDSPINGFVRVSPILSCTLFINGEKNPESIAVVGCDEWTVLDINELCYVENLKTSFATK